MFGLIELDVFSSAAPSIERYALGGGLFDESKVNRDEKGEFAPKGSGHASASMADEPFALGGAPKHGKGKKESNESQGSLFDTQLHGAEARDLPGQTNFLGGDPPATASNQKVSASDFRKAPWGSVDVPMTPDRQTMIEAVQKNKGNRGELLKIMGSEEQLQRLYRHLIGGASPATAVIRTMGWDREATADTPERSGIDKSDAPGRENEPFDSKKWDDDRDATIKASRKAGNKHLDSVHPSVETMRGRAIYNAHDKAERGVVRTVSNNGDVVVQWDDDHSAGKNAGLAETWLMPSDLKDYVFDDTKPRKTFAPPRRGRRK